MHVLVLLIPSNKRTLNFIQMVRAYIYKVSAHVQEIQVEPIVVTDPTAIVGWIKLSC